MATTAPVPVQRSYLCWIAASVVHLLGTLLYVAVTAGRTDEVLTDASTPPFLQTVYIVGLVARTVLVVVLVALTVWFAFLMRAGRQWARITLTVFGAVFGLTDIMDVAGGNGLTFDGQDVTSGAGAAVTVVTAAVTLVLLVAALVQQWLPAAEPNFRPAATPPW